MLDEVARQVEDRQPGDVVQLGGERRQVVPVGAEDPEGGARSHLLGEGAIPLNLQLLQQGHAR